MLKKYELKERFNIFKKYCKKIGIKFLSIFDIGSLNILNRIGLKLVKIQELNNFELIEQVVRSKKEIILSSGMASLTEIRKTIDFIQKFKRKLTVLHCVSSYPTSPNEVQIKRMMEIKKKI